MMFCEYFHVDQKKKSLDWFVACLTWHLNYETLIIEFILARGWSSKLPQKNYFLLLLDVSKQLKIVCVRIDEQTWPTCWESSKLVVRLARYRDGDLNSVIKSNGTRFHRALWAILKWFELRKKSRRNYQIFPKLYPAISSRACRRFFYSHSSGHNQWLSVIFWCFTKFLIRKWASFGWLTPWQHFWGFFKAKISQFMILVIRILLSFWSFCRELLHCMFSLHLFPCAVRIAWLPIFVLLIDLYISLSIITVERISFIYARA